MIPDWLYIASGVLAEAAVLIWDINSDYKNWKKDKPINHSNQGFWRLVLLTPSVVLFTIAIVWVSGSFWANVGITALCVVVSAGMVGFWFLLLFDGLYANKRRRNFWDLGSDGPEDGRTDNFLQGLKRWQHIALKVGGCVVFTGAYILLAL